MAATGQHWGYSIIVITHRYFKKRWALNEYQAVRSRHSNSFEDLVTVYIICRYLVFKLVAVTWQSTTWWSHQIEIFSALLALCAGNSPVTGEFPSQGPVTRGFDVSFDLCLNKRLSKQSWGWWFETPSRPLWRHCNEFSRLSNGGHGDLPRPKHTYKVLPLHMTHGTENYWDQY